MERMKWVRVAIRLLVGLYKFARTITLAVLPTAIGDLPFLWCCEPVTLARRAMNFDNNLAIVGKIEELALKKGCSVGQLTLAWVSALYERIIPIPGTTKCQNLDENVGGLEVELTEEDIKEVDRVAFAADVQGDRHPKSMMPYLYVDTVPLKETKV